MNNFAELLVTKFCHDITGPISAVHNGLEFMLMEEESGNDPNDPASIEMRKKAIELVQDSSIQSLARLQAYRIAYGLVRGNNDTEVSEVKDIFSNYFNKSNVELKWDAAFPAKVSSPARRLLVAAILQLSKIIIYGGQITISNSENGFVVTAEAERIKDPKNLLEYFHSNSVEPNLENVAILFMKKVSAEDNILISAGESAADAKRQVYISLKQK